ncbi:hypothetical protein GWK47_025401 [Chionoecetes opilio]|uniref:Uncharacterized protein n=1 Tax=Chionoecetes opilio TaxID=41210 RepID=A0A8J8WN49_CHIOP|nr:hypothetical protein GWK47_025401 [Chionoecetes opilio]
MCDVVWLGVIWVVWLAVMCDVVWLGVIWVVWLAVMCDVVWLGVIWVVWLGVIWVVWLSVMCDVVWLGVIWLVWLAVMCDVVWLGVIWVFRGSCLTVSLYSQEDFKKQFRMQIAEGNQRAWETVENGLVNAAPHCPCCRNAPESIGHSLLQCPRFHSHRQLLRGHLIALNVTTFDLTTLLAAAAVHPSRRPAVLRLTCAFLSKTNQLSRL